VRHSKLNRRMSALGQKLPRRGQVGMSALPPIAAAAVADRAAVKGHEQTCQLLRLYVDLLLNNNR
jgi:hypothetical protein